MSCINLSCFDIGIHSSKGIYTINSFIIYNRKKVTGRQVVEFLLDGNGINWIYMMRQSTLLYLLLFFLTIFCQVTCQCRRYYKDTITKGDSLNQQNLLPNHLREVFQEVSSRREQVSFDDVTSEAIFISASISSNIDGFRVQILEGKLHQSQQQLRTQNR